jgi:anti-sigma regulatory factor (Ser/Thr protein kinase)
MLWCSAVWVHLHESGLLGLGKSTASTPKYRRASRRKAPAGYGRSPPGVATAPSDSRTAPVGNLTLRLSGGSGAAARARRELSRLPDDLEPSLIETLRLLITELVSNAVKHAAAERVSLKVLVARNAVFTEVSNAGPDFDPAETGGPRTDHSGFGLFLVERLADRWGVVREGTDTKVWFELRRA